MEFVKFILENGKQEIALILALALVYIIWLFISFLKVDRQVEKDQRRELLDTLERNTKMFAEIQSNLSNLKEALETVFEMYSNKFEEQHKQILENINSLEEELVRIADHINKLKETLIKIETSIE